MTLRDLKPIKKDLKREKKKEKERMECVDKCIRDIDDVRHDFSRGFTSEHAEKLEKINEKIKDIPIPKTCWSKMNRLSKKQNPMDPFYVDLDYEGTDILFLRNIGEEGWHTDLSSEKCEILKYSRSEFNPEKCISDLESKIEKVDEILNLPSRELDQYLKFT